MTKFFRELAGLTLLLAALWGPLAGPAPAQPVEDGETTPGTTPIALVEEGYLAHRKGNYDEAVRVYTQIIQRRGLTKRERAIMYLLRGEAKRDAKRPEESLLDFTRALKQWPGYPQAYYFRGRVYETQGKLVEAYADVARALQLDPTRQTYETGLMVLKKRLADAGANVEQMNPAALEPVSPDVPEE